MKILLFVLLSSTLFSFTGVNDPSRIPESMSLEGAEMQEVEEVQSNVDVYEIELNVQAKNQDQCVFLADDSPQVQEIVQLSNYSELGDTDVEEFERRMQRISNIFIEARDRRGLFAAIYKVVSAGGREAVSNNVFQDNDGARRLIVEFGKTYFDSLLGHFANGNRLKPEWEKYFELAKDCSVHPLRVLYTGMNTHITLDLVDAIVRAKLTADFQEDYVALGDGLITKVGEVVDIVSQEFGVMRAETTMFLMGIDHPWATLDDGRNRISDFSMKFLRERAWRDATSQSPWMEENSMTNLRMRIRSRRQHLTTVHPQHMEIRPRLDNDFETLMGRVETAFEGYELNLRNTTDCWGNLECMQRIRTLEMGPGSPDVEIIALQTILLNRMQAVRDIEPRQTRMMTSRWRFRQGAFRTLLAIITTLPLRDEEPEVDTRSLSDIEWGTDGTEGLGFDGILD